MAGPQNDRKLILHIGHPKTATTTIQNALTLGELRVGDKVILYPGKMSQNYLRSQIQRYAETGEAAAGSAESPGLRRLSKIMAVGGYDYAVLSAETFEGLDPRSVKKALDDFLLPHVTDLSVICYLRPHAGRILSSFAERVKLGSFDGTLHDFYKKSLEDRRFFYAAKMAPWVNCFGSHMRIRPFVRGELADGSIVKDFGLTAFGTDAPVVVGEMASANESLCVEDLMLLRLMQQHFRERGKLLRHRLGWEFALRLVAAERKERAATKLSVDHALAERIRRDYRADAQETDAAFFGGRPIMMTELDRAVDEALPQAQPFDPEYYHSPETLRFVKVVAETIDGMLDNTSGNWPAYFHDRRICALQKTGRGMEVAPKRKARVV